MGQRLAQGKAQLVGIQFAAEHQGHDFGGRTRLYAGRLDFRQAFRVVGAQLGNSRVQAAEGFAVRRQHQHIFRQRLRIQPVDATL